MAGAAAEPGLIQAILNNRPDNVQERLMGGEDPNQMSLGGLPAIYVAIHQNNFPIVHMLLNHYAIHYNYIDNDGNTILHFAMEPPVKNVEIIRAICRTVNDVLFVQRRNNAGQSAYHFAAAYQNPQILDYLGEQGGSPTRLDDHRQSPLFFAVGSGNLPNVRYLSQWRNIDVPDEFGRTPIYMAAQLGFVDIVDYLIRIGADIHIRNNEGRSPMEIARMNGHAAIVSLIINQIHQRLARSAWERRRAAVSAWAGVRARQIAANAPAPAPAVAVAEERGDGLPRANAEHPNIPGRRNQRKTRRRHTSRIRH